MTSPSPQTSVRYLAIDAHKHYVMVGGVNAQKEVVLSPRRVNIHHLHKWASTHMRPTDSVVIEATTNVWDLHDLVKPLVAQVVVAHPPAVKLIASARVKTDKIDTINLARLLAANLIPEVWIPPTEVRELRSLMAHRRRLVKLQTQTRNRLHSMIHRYNLLPPKEDSLFSAEHRDWWNELPLPRSEHLRVHQDLAILDAVVLQIEEVDQELLQISTEEPWAAMAPFLMQLPGFGLTVAMTVLAAIGAISRFPSDKKLVGYSGLGASVHRSGTKCYTGRITKQGRKELRWVLVQAARTAAHHHPHWKREFTRLAKRTGDHKAYVAIARKLLVAVWHVLTKRKADRYAIPQQVASKLMRWSGKLGQERRDGLSTRYFIRLQLMRLGIGDELTHVRRGQRRHPIVSAQEVLDLRPDLRL